VGAPLEHGLAGLLGIGQHLGVDMHHHLVPLARGAGIEAVMEGCLREQGQGIGPLLGDEDVSAETSPAPALNVARCRRR
jgi:hypothetical protein